MASYAKPEALVSTDWVQQHLNDPKVKLVEELKDLHHGQTVVIRGDISKAALKQERKEPKK